MNTSKERLHIKLGSKCVANGDGLDQERIARIVPKVVALRRDHRVSMTCSGSVAKGKQIHRAMGIAPEEVGLKALAAAGSAGVVEDLGRVFRQHGAVVGQVPVIYSDMHRKRWRQSTRRRRRNLLEAYQEIEAADMIAVGNNNDVLTRRGDKKDELEKLKVGADNDWFAAETAILLGAKTLLLCTTGVAGFEIDGQVQHRVRADEIDDLSVHLYQSNEEGTGSMRSKLQAGVYAARAGIHVYICNVEADYQRVVAGHQIGTEVLA